MRIIRFRNKATGTEVRAWVKDNQTFATVIANMDYRPEMGITYVIRANMAGGDMPSPVSPNDVIPLLVSVIEVESCPKC